MTVAECYAHVVKLGFEDSTLEDDEGFYYALNRALAQVALLRPETGVCKINHAPLDNMAFPDSFDIIQVDDEVVFEAERGKSYYFEANGNGRAYIEAEGEKGFSVIGEIAPFSVTNGFKSFRGFIKKDGEFTNERVRIRFCSEYLFYVKNVAIYGKLLGASESDIPEYAPYNCYDIGKLAEDFLSLETAPLTEGKRVCVFGLDFDVMAGRTILIPRNKPGVYDVLYRKKAVEVKLTTSASSDKTELSFDGEICSLIPLLVASYVWAEDEPQKAEYYLNLYREREVQILSVKRNVAPVKFVSVNNW